MTRIHSTTVNRQAPSINVHDLRSAQGGLTITLPGVITVFTPLLPEIALPIPELPGVPAIPGLPTLP